MTAEEYRALLDVDFNNVKIEDLTDIRKIKIDKKMEQFKTDLCFIICYSSNKRFNFIFEELIDHVVGKIDIYSKL